MAKHAAPNKNIMTGTSTVIVSSWTEKPTASSPMEPTEYIRHMANTLKANYENADQVTKEFIGFTASLCVCAVLMAVIDLNGFRAVMEVVMAIIVAIMIRRIAFAPEAISHGEQYYGHHIQNVRQDEHE